MRAALRSKRVHLSIAATIVGLLAGVVALVVICDPAHLYPSVGSIAGVQSPLSKP
jgi:hypothetical protein